MLVGCLALVTFAMCLGALASRGYALFLIAAFLLCGIVVWAAPRRAAVPVVMLGALLIPTNAIPTDRIYGIPVYTPLAVVTICGALALWWNRRAQGGNTALSGYALASLLILIVTFIAQLGISRYASIVPIYQLLPFWISGLLLGSILATDLRVADGVGLVALPLAVLAIVESVINRPTLYSDLIGANGYDHVSLGEDRVASTFGHPLIAGTALIILAFLVLSKGGSRSAILFSIIAAAAIVTVSRSALVGLAGGALTYMIGSQRQRSQIVGAIALTALIGWLLISLVPAFHTSFDSRVLHASTQSQAVRLHSLQEVRDAFSQNTEALWLGRGLGGSNNYLPQTKTNLGWGAYDNEYVTSLFDSGLPVMLAVIGLIVYGVIRARPAARLLAPLVAAACAMFFTDGLYWPVTGLLFWMAVGLATARPDSRASGVP